MSLCFLTFHWQCTKSRPCPRGLHRVSCYWIHGQIKPNSDHLSLFILHIFLLFNDSHYITNSNYVPKFHPQLVFALSLNNNRLDNIMSLGHLSTQLGVYICGMARTTLVVLATGPHSQVSYGSSSTWNRTVAIGLTTSKSRTVGNGPVLPPNTQHFEFTVLPPIQYLSSDRIMTWSICRLCSFSFSFTSCCEIWDRRNIRWVTMENPRISAEICCYFTASERMLVRSRISPCEVKERPTLYNLGIEHVMIYSELINSIGAKVAGRVKWNHSPGWTRPKTEG